MYTNKSLPNMTRVTGQNLDMLMDADGKFFIQDVDNENFTELNDVSKYDVADHLDEGDMIVFITNKALEGQALKDIVFDKNVEEFYTLCEALEQAYSDGAMEQDDDQIIFSRETDEEEILVYDFRKVSGGMDDVASSIYEDLFYGGDANQIEVIDSVLKRVQDKAGDRFDDFIGSLRDVAEMRLGVLKEDYVPAY